MKQDPLDELSEQLFAAARRERADARVREQALEQVLSAAETRSPVRRGALAVLLLAAGLGAVLVIRLPRPNSAPSPTIHAERLRPSASPARAIPLPEPEPELMGSAQLPAQTNGSVSRPTPKPSASVTLDQELALLDRARRELAAGNSQAALSDLDHYERNLRGQQLRAEARLLRIQVLVQRGELERATRLARQFVSDYPNTPLSERARSLTGLAADEPSNGARAGELQ